MLPQNKNFLDSLDSLDSSVFLKLDYLIGLKKKKNQASKKSCLSMEGLHLETEICLQY